MARVLPRPPEGRNGTPNPKPGHGEWKRGVDPSKDLLLCDDSRQPNPRGTKAKGGGLEGANEIKLQKMKKREKVDKSGKKATDAKNLVVGAAGGGLIGKRREPNAGAEAAAENEPFSAAVP